MSDLSLRDYERLLQHSTGAYIIAPAQSGVENGSVPAPETRASFPTPFSTSDADSPRITHITYDSREVQKGTLFICKGAGFRPVYLEDAARSGAVAYLAEQAYDVPIPGLIVKDIRTAMAETAALFYGHPEEKLQFFQITGTKGKTSCLEILRACFRAKAEREGTTPAASLSTLEIDDGLSVTPSELTTPEAPILFKHLARAVQAGRRQVILEASSQALKYGRLHGIPCHYGLLLNIGNDHISPREHPSLEDYVNAKLTLAERADCLIVSSTHPYLEQILKVRAGRPTCFVELDEKVHGGAHVETGDDAQADTIQHDAPGRALNAIQNGVEKTTRIRTQLQRPDQAPVYRFTLLAEDDEGLHFHLHCPNGAYGTFTAPLIGAFQMENLAMATTAALLAGCPMDLLQESYQQISIPGRMMELSSQDGHISVLVDFAHNGMALRAVSKAMKTRYPSRSILILIGAVGEQSQGRRKDIAEALNAEQPSAILLTADDPGKEPVSIINADIIQALDPQLLDRLQSIEDRQEALAAALHWGAQQPDPVSLLILGRGVQADYKGPSGRIPYPSDLEQMKALLARYDHHVF